MEAWYPHKGKILAVGIDDAGFLETLYPGMTFITANGLDLPFGEASFDVIHSAAVLEHVGRRENQAQLLRECARVARRSAFLTTPNRWFPVEFHTSLPLLHWFPKPAFRALMRGMGRPFFAEEANLNLLGSTELRRLLMRRSTEQSSAMESRLLALLVGPVIFFSRCIEKGRISERPD